MGDVASATQQLEELECMLSMFPDHEELQVDSAAKETLETYVAGSQESRPDCRINYTLHYKDLSFGRAVPALSLTCSPGYPETQPMTFEVQCPQLTRPEMENLNRGLMELTTAACSAQEVVGLQLYQQMHEFVSQVQMNRNVEEVQDEEIEPDAPQKIVLGQRAIYFHHIIASNKRRVVKEWATELDLGGFSKIGWPGVVIVEGLEENVQEYVRRLQHLRWKQITVRGEQTEDGEPGRLDTMRRLPNRFHEFPEDGMSELATACRTAGLEELFLTTMKIYGRPDAKATVSNNKQIEEQ